MLTSALFFIYRHEYSFSSCKKWPFSEKIFLFLERYIHSKNKQLFLITPFLISTFETHK